MSQSIDHGNAKNSAPYVIILLAVHNGAQNLAEQLGSIAAQEHGNWSILAADYHSSDGSRAILDDFTAQGHPLRCLQGPGQGSAGDFLHLIRQSEAGPRGDWLAFSDQDDVWLPDRLGRGLAALREIDGTALYCSRT